MGGAIFNMQGQLTITDSTLVGNSAVGGADAVPDVGKGMGGAVFNLSGSFEARGSTFADNRADYDGDAIYNLVYDAQLARTAQTTLSDTIVTGPIGSTDLASNKTTSIQGTPLGTANANVSLFDLVRTMAPREQGTITGPPLSTADPLLGPLQDNGGPTETMALLPGSPALDVVPASGTVCPSSDQRGVSRPQGAACDVGAYEHAPPGVASDDPAALSPGGTTLQGQIVPNAQRRATTSTTAPPPPTAPRLRPRTRGPAWRPWR